MSNQTSGSDFLLLELSTIWELQILYFAVFLVLYLAIITGNLLIISAIAFDHHLHTPMYFFLMNLAMQDIGSVSVTIPNSMINSLTNNRHISYSGCVAQVLFFVFFLSSDFSLLTVMAYDRYVAICNPLHYEMVMNKQACLQMVASVWVSAFLFGVLHTSGTFASPFCSNVINQLFCEIPQLIKLACSDLYLFEIGVLLSGIVVAMGCFTFIIVTYIRIFTTVLRIPSEQGRQKAFSTCLPHLTVISTFVITGLFAYLRPPSKSPSSTDFVLTLMYCIVPPTLNPIMYSLRNKEIKNAMSKLLGLKNSSFSMLYNIIF